MSLGKTLFIMLFISICAFSMAWAETPSPSKPSVDCKISVTEGIVLVWDSKNATSAILNGEPVRTSGSRKITVDGTYIITVFGPGGSTSSCSQKVTISK